MKTTIIDVIEAFLTGLSCLIGGDQFYIFISQTNASIKTQYHLFVWIAIFTLVAAFVFYDEYNPDLMNVFHLYYAFLLFLPVLFIRQRSSSALAAATFTVFIAHVLTFFIVQCCISYSTNRYSLLTFVLGLFASRLLPSLCWIFTKYGNISIKFHSHTFALNLYLTRFLICLISIVLKILNGNFHMSIMYFRELKYDFVVIREFGFKRLYEHCIKIWPTVIALCSFYISVMLFLGTSPMMHCTIMFPTYFHYSYQLTFSLTNIEIVFHLLGSLVGITYPATNSVYPDTFYYTNFAIYCIYYITTILITRLTQSYTHFSIYYLVMIYSFGLGYLWAYNLHILLISTLHKICIYQENGSKACCGDKINNKCYCQYPLVVNKMNDCNYSKNILYTSQSYHISRLFLSSNYYGFLTISNINPLGSCIPNRFICSNGYSEYNSLDYSPLGPNAVLIVHRHDKSNGEDLLKACQEVCKNPCGSSCLNLIGIYELDTITTSSCEDCQLTIRLEAKKSSCIGLCASKGEVCTCGSDSPGTKCCIPLKCCSDCDQKEDCFKLCCCSSCKIRCFGRNGTSVYMCFVWENKCWFREIIPDVNPKFLGDMHKHNEFVISNIFISDCCHTDLQLDLHCKMKNNFYRLTPFGFQNKLNQPVSLKFMRKYGGPCCSTIKKTKCCCVNIKMTRVCLKYKPHIKNSPQTTSSTQNGLQQQMQDKEECINKCSCDPGCKSTCGCCTKGKKNCCCCMFFIFTRSIRSSFYKTIEPVRVKLVISVWLLFVLILLITFSTTSNVRDKRVMYYNFQPITSFKTVEKKVKKNKINSPNMVSDRLKMLDQEITSKVTTVQDKTNELKHILKLFENVFNPKNYETMKKHIAKETEKFIKKSQFNSKNANSDLVRWSFCIGLIYTYIEQMFCSIQSFFIKWEYLWIREYRNYRKLMNSYIGNLTCKSKFTVSLVAELNSKEQTPYFITKSRSSTWNGTHGDLDKYVRIYDKELGLDSSPPEKIEDRLKYYLDRWKHRLELLVFLKENGVNMLDWDPFLTEFPNINNWFDSFYPYITKTSENSSIPAKTLDKGIQVYVNYKLR